MRPSMRLVLLATLLVTPLVACAEVTSADFDVVARPTECSIVAPQSADPQAFLRCDATSTCVATPQGKGSCTALAASGEESDACSAQDECAPGFTCSSQLGCVRACLVGSGCADGTACQGFSNSPRSAGSEYGYCTPRSCDPLHPRDPQGEGLVACATDNCYFVGKSQTMCFPPGSSTRRREGGTCRDDRGCVVGHSCYEGTCTKLCRVGGSECATGHACIPGASDVGVAVFLGETYGHCE